MKAPRWTHSLKWRILASYSLILILGGVSTSVIGIRVTGRALLQQARQQVDHGLSAARTIYNNRLNELRLSVELLSANPGVRAVLSNEDRAAARDCLSNVRRSSELDFLSIADADGKVVLRTSGSNATGDVVAGLQPIAQALRGKSAASTELVPMATLASEDPGLAERAQIEVSQAPESASGGVGRLEAGMVLLAAAPMRDENGRVVGVVYAGELLSDVDTSPESLNAHRIVDQVKDTVFPSMRFEGRNSGAATIFQDGVRISTNVLDAEGKRAVGTRVSREVYEAVSVRGEIWSDRAFAVSDWYITAYEPITNLAGERIGILGVGLLQRPYTAVRDRVTLAFAAIALLCFMLIVVVTYLLTRSFLHPLEDMVGVSKEIAAGRLNQRVRVQDQSEVGVLSNSFNVMLDRIHDMNMQISQWAKILEQKVQERTEQLAKTQAAMGRQQRLASLGQLAAGIAHEINNPLGGILTFATLALEQLPDGSPLRDDVEEIVRQTDRCRRIVQELLEFSRQREARVAPSSVNAIVSRTVGMLEKQASFQNIKIVRELDPTNPVAVVDDSQLQQVFMNIILNAADSMNERGILAVTTGHDEANKEVFIRFTDNGCGIPERIREAIFDPFFTTKEPGKGTGLGLAVACRIVEAHHGRLEVDSEVGQGSIFTVVLPLAGDQPAPA